MMWPQLQAAAQLAVGHILNSLPEGLLIAAFAWIMLRLLPRQNSGTRFAVWFVALLAVVGLPFLNSGPANSYQALNAARPVIELSGSWGLGLFAFWFLAASVAMLRLGTGLLRLRNLRQSCVPVDVANLDEVVAKTVADFGSSRVVEVATSDRVSVPAAVGFFHPMIVLPAWALRELPPEELNIILLHEFAHLRRWDDWTNLLQKIVRAIFLFHPAVWWIENRLSLEREMACDDIVVAETGNPRGYAKCLISLLEKNYARRGFAMAQAAVHRAQEATLRLAQILDVRRSNSKNVWKPALAGVGVFSVMCLTIAAHAPRLVAFGQGPHAMRSYAAAEFSRPAQFPGAVVIPAALRTGSTDSHSTMPESLSAPAPRKVVKHRRAAARAPESLQAAIEQTPVRPVSPRDVSVAGSEAALPPSETLLLIHTSQRTGANSWSWSVYVYRVIWINPIQRGSEKAPVAHKT
jgi:Zn-dependent protease with chaperone function